MLDTVVPEKKGRLLHNQIIRMTNRPTVPNVFIGGQAVGGDDEIEALRSKRQLGALVKACLQDEPNELLDALLGDLALLAVLAQFDFVAIGKHSREVLVNTGREIGV